MSGAHSVHSTLASAALYVPCPQLAQLAPPCAALYQPGSHAAHRVVPTTSESTGSYPASHSQTCATAADGTWCNGHDDETLSSSASEYDCQ